MSAHMDHSPTYVRSQGREAWAGVKAAGAWQPVFSAIEYGRICLLFALVRIAFAAAVQHVI